MMNDQALRHPQDRVLQRGNPARKRPLPRRPGGPRNGSGRGHQPLVGRRATDDLGEEVVQLAPVLARKLTDVLAANLGGVEAIQAFGKAAIVGTDGEIEHGAALIHTPFFGNLVREYFEGESIICFADDRADAGASLVVPLWHKNAAATRTHYQTITTRIGDAPRAGRDRRRRSAPQPGPARMPASATASPTPSSKQTP